MTVSKKSLILEKCWGPIYFIYDGVDRYMTKNMTSLGTIENNINTPLHNISIIYFSAAGSVHTVWQCELMVGLCWNLRDKGSSCPAKPAGLAGQTVCLGLPPSLLL